MFDEMGVDNNQEFQNNNDYFSDDENLEVDGEQGVANLEEQEESLDNEEDNIENLEEETVEENKVDSAFAKRLSKERAKLQEQYSPYIAIMENEAKKYGMTTEEYVEALQVQMQREEEENNKKALLEEEERYSNLTPEEKEAIKWAKENKAKVEQEKQWLNDAQALVEKFPEVKGVQDIPSEAIDLYQKYNVPLVEAYDLCKNKLNVKRKEIEQETIKSIKANKQSNIGSLNATSTEVPVGIGDMKKEDFKSLVERVKRGEIKNL